MMASVPALLPAFVFVLSLWALLIGLVWRLLAALPLTAAHLPHARRGAHSVLLVSSLSLVGSGLVVFWPPGESLSPLAQAVRRVLMPVPTTVTVTLLTDPEDAFVAVGGLVLASPATLTLTAGEPTSYRVFADGGAYRAFAAVLTAEEDTAVSVWLDRLSESERRRLMLEEQLALEHPVPVVTPGLELLESTLGREGDRQYLSGRVRNGAEEAVADAAAVFGLYGASGELVALALTLTGPLEPGESRAIYAPVAGEEAEAPRILRLTALSPFGD